jgi:ABC-type multidrug transport system ATPase subunit
MLELRIENLSKVYPNGVRALNNVSLTIPRGLFGLLGPNGAGKSSLMRTIATLQDADSGTIWLDNWDIRQNKQLIREQLGYLPQEFGFYPSLSGESLLEHFATLKGLIDRRERREQVARLLQQVNLYDARKKKVGGYSGGMRQRLGIAVALIGNPRIVIVDEPTAGLDPTERNRFLNLLSEIGENAIVILSTHIVEDVRELCERMAIIANGSVIAEGSPQEVISAVEGRIWKRTIAKNELALAHQYYRVISTRLIAGQTVLFVYSDSQPDLSFSPVLADLEDAYFYFISAQQQDLLSRQQTPPQNHAEQNPETEQETEKQLQTTPATPTDTTSTTEVPESSPGEEGNL